MKIATILTVVILILYHLLERPNANGFVAVSMDCGKNLREKHQKGEDEAIQATIVPAANSNLQ